MKPLVEEIQDLARAQKLDVHEIVDLIKARARTVRGQVEAAVLSARDQLASAGYLGPITCGHAVNAAMERVGQEGNNDYNDLVQIAALVMAMAESAAVNNNRLPH